MNNKSGVVNERKLCDRSGEILFMDLRRWDGQIEEIVIDKGKKKKKTVLVDEQIASVKKIYNAWQIGTDYFDVPELYKVATLDEIREKDFSLAPSKYIEFIDYDLEIDYPKEMTRIQNEMRELLTLEEKSVDLFSEDFLRELDAFKMPVTKFNALLKLVKKILPLTVVAIKLKPLHLISV